MDVDKRLVLEGKLEVVQSYEGDSIVINGKDLGDELVEKFPHEYKEHQSVRWTWRFGKARIIIEILEEV